MSLFLALIVISFHLFLRDKATTILKMDILNGKAISLERAKKKRSYELICKKIKGEAKRLRATTIAIPKLEER